MKNIFRAIILSALTVLIITPTISAASGGVGGRPANPDPDNPRSQSIFIYTLSAGDSKNDQIYLSNGGDTDQVVQLYAVDGTVSNTGAFTCKQQVEPRTDVGAAISLSKTEVTVPANGNLLVDFTVRLPKAIDVGEHDGCIVIQKKEDNMPQQSTGSIQVHTRTAVRVVVLVPGTIHRQVDISDFSAVSSYKKGQSTYVGPQVSFGLKNTGNVSADVAVNVRVRDLFGNELHTPGSSGTRAFFSGQYPVIAGTTFVVNYDTEYQPFFGGWYKVKADITYNKQAGTFGVNNSGDVLRAETKEITIFFWPSAWFFVILGLLVVSALSFIGWRIAQSKEAKKRARDSLKQPSVKTMWGPYEVNAGDTIEQLAAQSGVSMSKIAAMNKLQPPYSLVPGQKIYLPRKNSK